MAHVRGLLAYMLPVAITCSGEYYSLILLRGVAPSRATPYYYITGDADSVAVLSHNTC